MQITSSTFLEEERKYRTHFDNNFIEYDIDNEYGENVSNRVLYEVKKTENNLLIENYYCPGYMRVKIINFTEINHNDLEAHLNLQFFLTLNFRGLPALIERKVRSMIRLDFNKDDTIEVKQGPYITLWHEKQTGIISYKIRQRICVEMDQSNIFMFPFGLINLNLSTSLQGVYLNRTNIEELIEQGRYIREISKEYICKRIEYYVWKRIKGLYDENVKKERNEEQQRIVHNVWQIESAKEQCKQMIKIMLEMGEKGLSDEQKQLIKILDEFLKIQIVYLKPQDKYQNKYVIKIVNGNQVFIKINDYDKKNDKKNISKGDRERNNNNGMRLIILEYDKLMDMNEEQIDFATQLHYFQNFFMLEDEIEKMKKIQDVHVKFNFMDIDNKDQKKERNHQKITSNCGQNFGLYGLSENNLSAVYTDDFVPPLTKKVNEVVELRDYSIIKPYCNAHFSIPIYKFPLATFTTIIVPLFLLGILNMSIYFQESTLSNRIQSLTNIMLAFVALVPVIKKELPFSSRLTMVEIFTYLEITCCLFCFWESMSIRMVQGYVFVWTRNGLYLLNALVQAFLVLFSIFLLLKFYVWDLGNFEMNKGVFNKRRIFNHQKWCNLECDGSFQNKTLNKKIKVAQFERNRQEQKQMEIKKKEDQKKKKEKNDKMGVMQ